MFLSEVKMEMKMRVELEAERNDSIDARFFQLQ